MKYSEDFKKKTVEYVLSHPKHSIRKAAQHLKVHANTLQTWVKVHKASLVESAVKETKKRSKVAKQKPDKDGTRRKKTFASLIATGEANVEHLKNLSENAGLRNNDDKNLEWENHRLKEENKRLKKVIKSLALED
jgi:transposase-like protein